MAASEYELERDARIQRNKQRLMELNLPELFDSFNASMRRSTTRQAHQPRSLPPRPVAEKRRSSRLANVEPASYNEGSLEMADALCERRGNSLARTTEESYNEEHVKALGDYKEEWVLFQDGYDSQGNRIYSKESGLTCHQCRQKTLGLRTTCSSCKSLQGVFCGDCLFMRYGENVKEANLNPSWTCPMCRDLCNCSIHRIRRGWAPTGSLYRRAIAEGYKSVAHYIVLNRLESPKESAAVLDAFSQTDPATSSKDVAPVQPEKEPKGRERPPLNQMRDRNLTDMLSSAKTSKQIRTGKGGKRQSENTLPVQTLGIGRMTRSSTRA